jgi:hypothetical protein
MLALLRVLECAETAVCDSASSCAGCRYAMCGQTAGCSFCSGFCTRAVTDAGLIPLLTVAAFPAAAATAIWTAVLGCRDVGAAICLGVAVLLLGCDFAAVMLMGYACLGR